MTFKLAHISDIHLGPLPKTKLRELASKRVTGYINWKRNRAGDMGGETLKNIVQAVAALKSDHLAITGDLINIGLDLEVEAAANWLNTHFDPAHTSVVPGNHDAYVRGTLAKALFAWSPFMTNDDGSKTLKNSQFPFVRVRDQVAIIGVSSAVATPAFVAAGRFGKSQAKKLAQILDQTQKAGLFRVVMIHHPPVRNATPPHKRLYGIDLFQETIAKHGAELVLHGHTHLPQRHQINGSDGIKVPVIGVPSASQSHGGKKPAAAYNLFEISGTKGAWRCTLQAHSISATTIGGFEKSGKRLLINQDVL